MEITAVNPRILTHRSQFWNSNGPVFICFTSQFKIVSNLKSEVQRMRLLFMCSITKFYGFLLSKHQSLTRRLQGHPSAKNNSLLNWLSASVLHRAPGQSCQIHDHHNRLLKTTHWLSVALRMKNSHGFEGP